MLAQLDCTWGREQMYQGFVVKPTHRLYRKSEASPRTGRRAAGCGLIAKQHRCLLCSRGSRGRREGFRTPPLYCANASGRNATACETAPSSPCSVSCFSPFSSPKVTTLPHAHRQRWWDHELDDCTRANKMGEYSCLLVQRCLFSQPFSLIFHCGSFSSSVHSA